MNPTPFNGKLIAVIAKWLEKKPPDVINIAAGPKREDWFNAECIVALSHVACFSTFIVYGEQSYRTALGNAGWTKKELADPDKRPDVVGYVYGGGPAARDQGASDEWSANFVIEAKVLYAHERNRVSQLTALRTQLLRARRHGVSAIGILYLIDFRQTRKRKGVSVSKPFYEALDQEVGSVFQDTQYTWLRTPTPLRGMHWKYTSFKVFPSMGISIGVAALQLK